MNYILFDGPSRLNLLPFTFTRPVADIRIGIMTVREKWEKYLGVTTTSITEDYLSSKFPMVEMEENILINAAYLPSPELVEKVRALKQNQAIFKDETVIAFYAQEGQADINFSNFKIIEFNNKVLNLNHTYDIFAKNGEALKADFEILSEERVSQPLSVTNNIIGENDIFIEEGAIVEFATLNTKNGPIYIGKNAEIMEGSMIRGPFAICNDSTVKLGSKIYGPTTIGPHCKVGGEVNNSVLFGYSNKGHDGFLGNSVLGEWCNIGADSNNSNLKNNYAEVKLWNYDTENFAKTGLQFCGLIMGDHSKCGINTMFNTGTVVGVSANIYGSGFPRNFVPSFSWGGSSGFSTYLTKKAFEAATVVMKRRNLIFSDEDKNILLAVFEDSKKWRKTE